MQAYESYFSDEKDFHNFRPYPFYRYYCDAGLKTVACCSVRGGEYGYLIPNYRKRFNNITQMAGVVKAQKGVGLLITSWSEIQSPDELTFYPILFGAECAWSSRDVQIDKYNEKFMRECFDCDEHEIIQSMNILASHFSPLLYVVEERSDLQLRGAFADKDSYQSLFAERWRKYWDNDDSFATLEKLRMELEKVQNAYRILKEYQSKIGRGFEIYDHLLIAGRMSVHKFRQAILLKQVEDAINSSEPLSQEEANDLLRTLVSFRKEMVELREDNERLFVQTYSHGGVQRRLSQMFEGEAEYIDKQIRQLRRIIKSNICLTSKG